MLVSARRWAALAVISILVACAPTPHGDPNPLDGFAQLKPGISTLEDAQAILGPAKSFSDVGRGRVLLQWHQFVFPGVGWLGIVFNGDDHKMLEVSNVIYN